MSKILFFLFLTIVSLILCNDIQKVEKEMKKVYDIKQFYICAEKSKDISDTKKILDVLEHKKGYQKQMAYLKRVLPHNKDITLCKKSSKKIVPAILDEELFALETK
jgi:hypothetical protein